MGQQAQATFVPKGCGRGLSWGNGACECSYMGSGCYFRRSKVRTRVAGVAAAPSFIVALGLSARATHPSWKSNARARK